jgi:hypothetical protein
VSQNQIIDISVRFEEDTLTSVSPNTAHKLVDIMESDSLESLIQLLLRNLAAETGLLPTSSRIAYPHQAKFLPKNKYAYPRDDGLPTAAELDEISRIVPQDLELKEISSLFEIDTERQTVGSKEYSLNEMMSQVTEENIHEHLGFGSTRTKE